MVWASGLGQGLCFLLLFLWLSGIAFRVEAVVSNLQDVAVTGEANEQHRYHLGIAKDAGPLAGAQVGIRTALSFIR